MQFQNIQVKKNQITIFFYMPQGKCKENESKREKSKEGKA